MHEAFTELVRVGDVYVEQLQKFGINAAEAKADRRDLGL